jgi:hypothetical protein
MRTIQIIVEERLLAAADREVRRTGTNRSSLFREAMREYLRQRRIAEAEERERLAYTKHPPVEFDGWDRVAAWPEDWASPSVADGAPARRGARRERR